MSLVQEARTALLELFPELAEAEARASAEAAASTEEVALADVETEEAAEQSGSPERPGGEEVSAEGASVAEAESKEKAEEQKAGKPEKEEEGPRQVGILELEHSDRGVHLDVLLDPDLVVKAAEILDGLGFSLEAVTGVDWIKDNRMEVIYDYNHTGGELCRVVVRTFISREKPEITTISEVFPGANWHERETHDFFGIVFTGHPCLEPLLLPEDADFHPLLKDFKP
ncbi:NADH-quinone oxidoreductase subunit C [Desulfolithobacter sp.]